MKQVDWDKLENLPYRQNRWQRYTEIHGSFWDFHHWRKTHHWWILCHRILKNNIGKPYDMTYHYLCTKVPCQYRHHFDYYFSSFRRVFDYLPEYYIDESGIIRTNKFIFPKNYHPNLKDPKVKRYYAEKEKARRKEERIKKEELKMKEYSFLTKSELEIKNDFEKNKICIIKHGFDPETSFKFNN